jgi:PAS domain S-box-containing protein
LFGNGALSTETPFEFAQSMNGFLLSVTREGKLLYISENVTEYLGHSMVDMMTQGDSIYDIIDKRDHATVQAQLMQTGYNASGTAPGISDEKAFFCRMNVSRSFRRQAGFGDHKVMHVHGHFVAPMIRDHFGNQPVFTAICSPLVTPDVKDTIIQNNTMIFQSVHGLDMKYMEMAPNGEHHLGYKDEDIKEKSWYELLHPEDLAEAKEKHIQLIKSSHEMGCMLTVRLLTAYGDWIWINMVMHIRQPFLCDNADPAIVCINHVIQDGEAPSFKLQSQLYSSHIARSPEIFGSPPSGSPPHTITQIPAGSGDSGDRFPAGNEESSYQGSMTVLGSSQSAQDQGSQKPESSQKTGHSPSDKSGSNSPGDHKQMLRAEMVSRLKRKLSESKDNVKPPKVSRVHPPPGYVSHAPANGNASGTASIDFAPLLSSESSMSLDDALFSLQDVTGELAINAPPAYVDMKPDILLNQKEALFNQDFTSPLTPESIMSDGSNCEDMSVLMIDVGHDMAVVPSSVLTPASSPASSPCQALSPPNVTDIHVDSISLFSNSTMKKPQIVVKENRPAQTLLPELDVMSIEQFLGQIETSLLPPSEIKEEVKEEIVEESEQEEEDEAKDVAELLAACDEQNLAATLAASLMDMVQMMENADALMENEQDDNDDDDNDDDQSNESNTTNLSPSHGDLLNELHQLNQLAASSSPSYGTEDLTCGLFNSTL